MELPGQPKPPIGDIDLSQLPDLVLLGVKTREVARCRLLGTDKVLKLRSADVWDVDPGEIATVEPRKHLSYAGHP